MGNNNQAKKEKEKEAGAVQGEGQTTGQTGAAPEGKTPPPSEGQAPEGEKPEGQSASPQSGQPPEGQAPEGETTPEPELFSLAELAEHCRLPSWHSAALHRMMGWESGKRVTEAEYKKALRTLSSRRIGG